MGVVYMIFCLQTGEVYYGSTKHYSKRQQQHKSQRQCTSKQIIERGNYEFIILEQVEDTQLLVREKHYITTFLCVNKRFPLRSDAQYRQENKKKIAQYYQENKEKIAQYYQENKEKIAQKNSALFECECGITCNVSSKARHFRTKKHTNFISTGTV
jgi:predicted GIY-YIG superfamily endonuclease